MTKTYFSPKADALNFDFSEDIMQGGLVSSGDGTWSQGGLSDGEEVDGPSAL